MPERDKQVDDMARTLAGAGRRPMLDRLGTKPVEVTDAEWDEAQTLADRVYVDLVEGIDFQRVLIEAQKRHAIVHESRSTFIAAPDIGFGSITSLCHGCITEVLLATATNPPWTEQADSPRYVRYHPEQFVATLDPFEVVGGSPTLDDEPDATPDWAPPTTDGPADEIANAEASAWRSETHDDQTR